MNVPNIGISGGIPGILNPGVRDVNFFRERRVDAVLEMWKLGLGERPRHLEMKWENGDTAALHIDTDGFSVVVTIKEEEG